jgi:protein-tyrosine-phosphatase/DNA-binding transcriptional ArsR family regulator
MESDRRATQFAALGHPGRLSVFRLLARHAPQAVAAGDIAAALGLKPNTLSVYLAALTDAGLIAARRDGRHRLYRVEMRSAGALIDYLAADCCRGRPDLCATATAAALAPERSPAMEHRPWNVLFICSGNSARSIIAEALLRDLGGARFRAFSAGTRPQPQINPRTLDQLVRNGHATEGLHPKGVDMFQAPDAPVMDFVFTVCDQAANEECPPWPGQPITAHWGLPDPVKATGTDAQKAFAFAETYRAFHRRLTAFTALPFDTLDRVSLQAQVDLLAAESEEQA